ncbi:MAG: hypothetical protein R6U27_00825 [Desulfobacterales bacterium]
MNCHKCGSQIEKGEEAEYLGKILCEDCYMDALSPAKPCDPWAVYTAKSMAGYSSILTKLQENILAVLKETGSIEPETLASKLGLKMSDLQREIATLRHMERVRATMEGDKKVFCLW